MFILNNDRNSARIATLQKMIPTRRVMVISMVVIVIVLVTTGFVWMRTDPVIAPPSLRVLDWLWTVFVCHCHS
jgi:hypothetical protein